MDQIQRTISQGWIFNESFNFEFFNEFLLTSHEHFSVFISNYTCVTFQYLHGFLLKSSSFAIKLTKITADIVFVSTSRMWWNNPLILKQSPYIVSVTIEVCIQRKVFWLMVKRDQVCLWKSILQILSNFMKIYLDLFLEYRVDLGLFALLHFCLVLAIAKNFKSIDWLIDL